MFYKKQFLTSFFLICVSVVLFCGIMSDIETNNQKYITEQSQLIQNNNNEVDTVSNIITEKENIVKNIENINHIEEDKQTEQSFETEENMYSVTTINIRESPDMNSKIITTVPTNTLITIVSRENGWYKVKRDNQYYYIKDTLLSKEKQQITIASRNAEPRIDNNNNNNRISLGTYKLTAYCGCAKCCGKSTGITASGARAKSNYTIAAPSNLAFGTKIEINGQLYTVEDRGGAIKGNRIDIYFSSHSEALKFGVQYKEVFKIN